MAHPFCSGDRFVATIKGFHGGFQDELQILTTVRQIISLENQSRIGIDHHEVYNIA